MSDRLKIRVWDKYFNRYWTDEQVKNNIQWLLYPDNENIENVIIEQCTGLRDKNGKLVYEGDICYDAHFDQFGKVFLMRENSSLILMGFCMIYARLFL